MTTQASGATAVGKRADVRARSLRSAPGPRGQLFLGHLRQIERNPLEFLTRSSRDYGDVVGLRLLGLPGVLVTHPDAGRRPSPLYRQAVRAD